MQDFHLDLFYMPSGLIILHPDRLAGVWSSALLPRFLILRL
jgi:hypothetical protein